MDALLPSVQCKGFDSYSIHFFILSYLQRIIWHYFSIYLFYSITDISVYYVFFSPALDLLSITRVFSATLGNLNYCIFQTCPTHSSHFFSIYMFKSLILNSSFMLLFHILSNLVFSRMKGKNLIFAY